MIPTSFPTTTPRVQHDVAQAETARPDHDSQGAGRGRNEDDLDPRVRAPFLDGQHQEAEEEGREPEDQDPEHPPQGTRHRPQQGLSQAGYPIVIFWQEVMAASAAAVSHCTRRSHARPPSVVLASGFDGCIHLPTSTHSIKQSSHTFITTVVLACSIARFLFTVVVATLPRDSIESHPQSGQSFRPQDSR